MNIDINVLTNGLMVIKNDKGQIVSLQGLLPDGTYGVVSDESQPFTKDELTNPKLFKKHADNLARRVDERLAAYGN